MLRIRQEARAFKHRIQRVEQILQAWGHRSARGRTAILAQQAAGIAAEISTSRTPWARTTMTRLWFRASEN